MFFLDPFFMDSFPGDPHPFDMMLRGEMGLSGPRRRQRGESQGEWDGSGGFRDVALNCLWQSK